MSKSWKRLLCSLLASSANLMAGGAAGAGAAAGAANIKLWA